MAHSNEPPAKCFSNYRNGFGSHQAWTKPEHMNEKLPLRSVIQFSSGPKKGLLCQVISGDGKVLARDMDGSQYAFNPGPEDTFVFTGGLAALGPKLDAPLQPSPALPPPLNTADLLEPLPPEVKAKPMNSTNAERIKPPKQKPEPKPKPEPYTGPKLPYVFRVDNALGDSAEVTIKVRSDLQPSNYKGAAIIMATKIIPPSKPYQVVWRIKE